MRFTPIHPSRVASVDVAPPNTVPRPGLVITQADGDVPRQYGPCYEVSNDAGESAGFVWREATLDSHGREVSCGWRAMRRGCTVAILCVENTRHAAAARL